MEYLLSKILVSPGLFGEVIAMGWVGYRNAVAVLRLLALGTVAPLWFSCQRMPMPRAEGTFEVKLEPLQSTWPASDAHTFGRMKIDKRFAGDLQGTSLGEMLSARTQLPSSAGYVAIEEVQGTLAGKSGRFVLQHFGMMSAAEERLVLEVVPDSGTEALTGLRGQMQILREEGTHRYIFEYALA